MLRRIPRLPSNNAQNDKSVFDGTTSPGYYIVKHVRLNVFVFSPAYNVHRHYARSFIVRANEIARYNNGLTNFFILSLRAYVYIKRKKIITTCRL